MELKDTGGRLVAVLLVMVILFVVTSQLNITGKAIIRPVTWDLEEDFTTLDTSKWSTFSNPPAGVWTDNGKVIIGYTGQGIYPLAAIGLKSNPVQDIQYTLWEFSLKVFGEDEYYSGVADLIVSNKPGNMRLYFYGDKVVLSCPPLITDPFSDTEAEVYSFDTTDTHHVYNVAIGGYTDDAILYVDDVEVARRQLCDEITIADPQFYATTNFIRANHYLSLDSFNVKYTFDECIADWQCTDWSACINSGQIRSCTDVNDCGSADGKPIETQSCTCIPDWECTDWSVCDENLQQRTCTDVNSCGIIHGKPVESQACTTTTTTLPQASETCSEVCISNGINTGSQCANTNPETTCQPGWCLADNVAAAGIRTWTDYGLATDCVESDSEHCYCGETTCCGSNECETDASCTVPVEEPKDDGESGQEDDKQYNNNQIDCHQTCQISGFEAGICSTPSDVIELTDHGSCLVDAAMGQLCSEGAGYINYVEKDASCQVNEKCMCITVNCCDKGCAPDGGCSEIDTGFSAPEFGEQDRQEDFFVSDFQDTIVDCPRGCAFGQNCISIGEKVIVEEGGMVECLSPGNLNYVLESSCDIDSDCGSDEICQNYVCESKGSKQRKSSKPNVIVRFISALADALKAFSEGLS